MREVEEERRSSTIAVNGLEKDKKDLEASNAQTIEENRYLLDQLETMNNSVSNADAQILALSSDLDSTRKEMEKLTILAARAADLEAELLNMELEQASLQIEAVTKDEEKHTAIQRWKSAERTIARLSEQIDRIEKETSQERGQHTELVARLERRRAVEQELDRAAGRLSGAAVSATGPDDGDKSVVSSFVREILQDNANLQMGIVELRDMLTGSNEEVESLREQILQHQPLQSESANEGFLDSELAKIPSPEIPVHVHHHYHAAPKADIRKEKAPAIRRPRKKRYVTSPGFRTPTAGFHTPRTPGSPHLQMCSAPNAATILSHTSATVPPYDPSNKRFSQTSLNSFTIGQSSTYSSPPSSFREQSIFDTTEDVFDHSRPMSPASTTIDSADFLPRHQKHVSDTSLKSFPAQASPSTSQFPQNISAILESPQGRENTYDSHPKTTRDQSTILEEPEDEEALTGIEDDPNAKINLGHGEKLSMKPRLHRACSAESVLSSRGVDIPKLRRKRSQLINSPRASLGASSLSVDPITSSTSAIGRTSKSTRYYDSSNYNRLLLGHATLGTTVNPSEAATSKKGLSKAFGGWMVGKWGATPASPAKVAISKTAQKKAVPSEKDNGKASGLASESPTQVEALKINNTLLNEALCEG
ncbi:uncharacterized protein KY384_001503 [Bacidia gigantensis]|uniref:uncharacterized protein n=1 Tax=Bacidia gigantensis TaxID=2732470 RepID=UPI001D03BEAE|nr:uncharacterized protein KY384_001503 [Bacidia gigantensis]KAG8533762.1 hypothetical protein KY384_001503 [Bacidia gigantensis]